MPELPEVETTRRGITPYVPGGRIVRVEVRDGRLRQPVPPRLNAWAAGQSIHGVARRGKFLLFVCDTGTLLLHLGMSGSLRVVEVGVVFVFFVFVVVVFVCGLCLWLCVLCCFGLVLWV